MSGTRDELDEGDFLTKVRRLSGKLPMLRDALAAYACMVDANTPAWAKATIACALAYFVCPLDAIPDWLFPVGYTDDAAVLTGALVAVEPYLHAAHYRGLDDSDWRALDFAGSGKHLRSTDQRRTDARFRPPSTRLAARDVRPRKHRTSLADGTRPCCRGADTKPRRASCVTSSRLRHEQSTTSTSYSMGIELPLTLTVYVLPASVVQPMGTMLRA